VPEPPLPTSALDKRRLDALLSRAWALADEKDHPLGRLQGLTLGSCRLLALLGSKNNVGSRYFQLLLVDSAGRMAEEAVAFGLHNSGPYPGYNWAEVFRYEASPQFGGEAMDLRSANPSAGLRTGLEERLFRALSDLVPAGGHLMVEYESPCQKESERILSLGYPPVTSPLGYLLFRVGCRSFRDWYISEGGREGPRKLQGYKPLNQALAGERTEALRRQVEAFLAGPESPQHGSYGRTARRLGKAVLEALAEEQRPGSPPVA
jgi:hypothetical protein